MTYFFTSDTHFNHKNIIQYCNRPFSSVEEMNEVIIKNWNDKVSKDDVVYHLGDFGFGSVTELKNILTRLNGKIHLVMGNHDFRIMKLRDNFVSSNLECYIHIEDQNIILNHYPLLTYSQYNNTWQLFGHVHSSKSKNIGNDVERLQYLLPTQYDVGVDNNNYTPVSFDELKVIINEQIYKN